eukprot:340847_1
METNLYKKTKLDIDTFYNKASLKETQICKYSMTVDFTNNKAENMDEKWNALLVDIEKFVLNLNLSTETMIIIPNYKKILNLFNKFILHEFMSDIILQFLFGNIETLSVCFNKNEKEVKHFMCSMSLIIIDIQMIQLSNENHWFGLPQ